MKLNSTHNKPFFPTIKNWMCLLLNKHAAIVFIVALILQSFTVFSSESKYECQNTSVTSKVPVKEHQHPFDLFVEEESSEEDEIKQDHSAVNSLKNRLFSIQEIHYTASIKTLYLNLVSSKLHTIETPLIVLYHTWKSDLV